MAATTRGREVQINQVVFDQADFFQSDGFNRVVGLIPANLAPQLFYQNLVQPWPLVDGSGVLDNQVVAGRLYWSEVAGSPGIYSVRWRPNAVGYWRLLVAYAAGTQIMGQDYDVRAAPVFQAPGIKSSFTKC